MYNVPTSFFLMYKAIKIQGHLPIPYIFYPGVDGTAVVVLKFSGNRLAVCTCSMTMELISDAVIIGTKGTIKV